MVGFRFTESKSFHSNRIQYRRALQPKFQRPPWYARTFFDIALFSSSPNNNRADLSRSCAKAPEILLRSSDRHPQLEDPGYLGSLFFWIPYKRVIDLVLIVTSNSVRLSSLDYFRPLSIAFPNISRFADCPTPTMRLCNSWQQISP